MKLMNANDKTATRLSKNYFFITTLLVLLLNIFVCFWAGGYCIVKDSGGASDLSALYQGIINSYNHSNSQHITLNMLCFIIAGIYIERKIGSYCFFFLMIALTFMSEGFLTILWSAGGIGFSGINYAIYGFIFVFFVSNIFRWGKNGYNLFEITIDIVVIALIYLAMCFCGGTSTFAFKPYPYDLLTHGGHYAGLISGILVGIISVGLNIYHKFSKTKN